MGYVNTPAFMTHSTSRRGGDRIWPGNPKLVLRRANIYPTAPANLPTAPAGTQLGWVEAIGPALTALTSVGKTVYDIRQGQMDSQRARAREQDDRVSADKATEQARAAAVQAQAQIKQAETAAAAPAGAPHASHTNLRLLAGGGAAALVVLYFVLRRK